MKVFKRIRNAYRRWKSYRVARRFMREQIRRYGPGTTITLVDGPSPAGELVCVRAIRPDGSLEIEVAR